MQGPSAFQGSMMPEIGLTLIAPEPIIHSSRFARVNNRALKEVLKAVLFLHHAKHLPGHFVKGARQKYGHKPRQESTRKRKLERRHHDVDNVSSGKTSRRMKANIPKATTTGNAKTIITAIMRYRFGFPISSNPKDPAHVTIQQMAIEIAAWTESEQEWAARKVAELYGPQMEYELRNSPRLLKKYQTLK